MLHERYELQQVIGSGAHGNVYHGLDTTTHTSVAIKHLKPEVVRSDPDLLLRFQREAEALRQLNHPNIVHVLDTFAEGSDHYIVMDFLAHGSLRGVLEQTPCLPLEQTLRLALDLSDALIRAHRLDIIHRDLKPANVLLADDGSPRLTDFGVAFLPGKERLTESRGFVGTLAYLAPEVINSEPPSPASDIWAFGVMLFEMLAGKRPFDHGSATGLIITILTQPPADLEAARPDVPAALIDLIYRMLDKNVATRVPTVRRVGAELEAILQQTLKGSSAAAVGWVDVTASTDKIDIKPAVKHNLPAQSTAFIGREREMGDLLRLVRPSSAGTQPRLVTLLGPGGMGKSRLSLEVAQRLLTEDGPAPYPDGVYFVALAPLPTSDRLPQAIAEAVGYVMQKDIGDPLDQIVAFLADRRTVLILDNFEHLMEGTAVVSRLLEAAPHLTLLVTSRERLNLSAEHLLTLKGLSTPTGSASVSPLEYDAVQLFVQSAQRVQPGFTLKEADMGFVAQICRLVQGLPLGVMLAATWAEMLSLAEIAAELRKSAEFLEANMKDLPERHRSMRAVFEYSWRRLSESERQTLARLSVFSGPFSRAAAQAVTEASLRDLMQLVNKSLLYRDAETGLYTLHELVRQFAEAHLKALAGEHARALEAHSRYYCAWLKQLEPIMQGTQVEAFNAMDGEIDNIRQAWQQAIARKDVATFGGCEITLEVYCRLRGLHTESIMMIGSAIKIVEAQPSTPDRDRLLGHLYTHQTVFPEYLPLLTNETVQSNLERAVSLLKGVNDEIGLSYALLRLAWFWWDSKSDREKTTIFTSESLVLAQKHHSLLCQAFGEYSCAIFTLKYSGETMQDSLVWAEKALAHYRQLQHPEGQGDALTILGKIYWARDEPQRALEMYQTAVTYYDMIRSGDLIDCWLQQSYLYLYIGEYESGHHAAQKALLLSEHGFGESKPWIYRNIGILYHFQGHYQEAIENYTEALRYSAFTRMAPNSHLNLQFSIVWSLIDSNQLAQADHILRKIEEDEKLVLEREPFWYGWLIELRGMWYIAQDRFVDAEHQYLQSMKKYLQMEDESGNITEALLGFAEAQQRQKHFYDAGKTCALILAVRFISHWKKQKARAILDIVRPHLSDEEWAHIEKEVAATTLKAYAEALVKDRPET